MTKGDGGDISGAESSTQPKRTCIFFQKRYNGKKDSKYCSKPCFQDSLKAHSKNASLINSINQASSQPTTEAEIFSTPKSVTKSKRPLSANSSIDESMSDSKKTRYEDLSSFTEDPELSHLDSLSKEAVSSKLRAVLDLAKAQHDHIAKMEAELINVKLAFADSMTLRYMNQQSSSSNPPPSSDNILPSTSTYYQAVKGQQAPVLVASYAASAKPADRISLAGMEELLGSSGGGPVPASVRQKDNNIIIRLADPADLDRAKTILESKAGPDSINVFNSVSRPSKFYPAVALFVNLSYLPSLKEELMLRNRSLKGKIESVSQLFAKPDSQKGHVKILLNCKVARDLALAEGELDFFNTTACIVEILLDREVRRCFKC